MLQTSRRRPGAIIRVHRGAQKATVAAAADPGGGSAWSYMESENEIKQYLKLLIKEYETSVLDDERYHEGQLDEAFIRDQYNVAVDKYLRNVTPHEAKGITDAERLYYRGWISSYLTLSLQVERQKAVEKETALLLKQQAKLEKDKERLQDKIARLEDKLAALKEKAKKK